MSAKREHDGRTSTLSYWGKVGGKGGTIAGPPPHQTGGWSGGAGVTHIHPSDCLLPTCTFIAHHVCPLKYFQEPHAVIERAIHAVGSRPLGSNISIILHKKQPAENEPQGNCQYGHQGPFTQLVSATELRCILSHLSVCRDCSPSHARTNSMDFPSSCAKLTKYVVKMQR